MSEKTSIKDTISAFVGAILFISFCLWATTDPFGYWAEQEQLAEEREEEKQAQIERWESFSAKHGCEFIGMDGNSEQHLCNIDYQNDTYTAVILYHVKGNLEWEVISIAAQSGE